MKKGKVKATWGVPNKKAYRPVSRVLRNKLVYNRLNLYSKCFTKEALEGFADFKIGGQIFHTVKYADDLVLLAREEKVLQDIIDKPIKIIGCYGMEINVEKTKVMRISRQLLPVKIMIDQSN
jgi:hypothetical protein